MLRVPSRIVFHRLRVVVQLQQAPSRKRRHMLNGGKLLNVSQLFLDCPGTDTHLVKLLRCSIDRLLGGINDVAKFFRTRF